MRERILRIGIILIILTSLVAITGCERSTLLLERIQTAAAYVTPEPESLEDPTASPGASSTPFPTQTPTATFTSAPTKPSCDRGVGGQVARERIHSQVLGFSYEVSVYTPPCYGEEGIEYPVLYLLHGQGMDDTYWLNMGAAEIADSLIAQGGAPFMMVMPREVKDFDPVTDDGFSASVLTELIPWVEANYDVCAERECRAIGGISRGGGWATRLVARNFDTFSALGAHSMGLMAGDWWQIQKHLETRTVEEYPRIWVDRGEDDFLFEGIDFFVSVLEDNGIPHEFHIWPGSHNGAYWQAHVAEYIAWYAAGWEAGALEP